MKFVYCKSISYWKILQYHLLINLQIELNREETKTVPPRMDICPENVSKGNGSLVQTPRKMIS